MCTKEKETGSSLKTWSFLPTHALEKGEQQTTAWHHFISTLLRCEVVLGTKFDHAY